MKNVGSRVCFVCIFTSIGNNERRKATKQKTMFGGDGVRGLKTVKLFTSQLPDGIFFLSISLPHFSSELDLESEKRDFRFIGCE
jgi:hypothetical protein